MGEAEQDDQLRASLGSAFSSPSHSGPAAASSSAKDSTETYSPTPKRDLFPPLTQTPEQLAEARIQKMEEFLNYQITANKTMKDDQKSQAETLAHIVKVLGTIAPAQPASSSAAPPFVQQL